MKYRVDMVVPVFNEPENFQAFYDFIVGHTQSDWNLLMVYDFEEDTTLAKARPLAARDSRVRLVRNSNRGALNAIRTGMQSATSEAVLVAMVDDPPGILEKVDTLVERFYTERATIAVASRYMRGGSHTGGPFLKGLLSRMAGISLYFVIGLPTHDATYATRIYKKSFLDRVHVESKKGFELTLELTLKAYFEGGKIIEIPVSWEERVVGTSRFNLRKWLPAYLYWYFWGLRRRYLPFTVKKSRNAVST